MILVEDIEIWLMELEARRELKRQKHFKQIADSIRDGNIILKGMSLIVAQRFGVDIDEEEHSPCWIIADHYIFNDDLDCGFMDWLYCENAPFLCRLSDVGKYFPEFRGVAKSNREIVDYANKSYGLDLKIDTDWYNGYVYSFSLNFNDFIPIDLEKVMGLKQEIDFCKKYGLETEELEGKLEDYGVSYEALGGESDEKIHP